MQAAQKKIQWQNAESVWTGIGWMCKECKHVNYMGYDTWLRATNFSEENECIQECNRCEKGQNIPSPF